MADSNKNETANIEYSYEEFEDSTCLLTTKTGEKIEFYRLAGIEYDGSYYEVLSVCRANKIWKPDQAIVFRVKDGWYDIEEDLEVCDVVFDIFEGKI